MTLHFTRLAGVLGLAAIVASAGACRRGPAADAQKTFATPDEAARALVEAAKRDRAEDLTTLFGPDVKELVDSSDPVRARQNRQVFVVAAKERLQIVDEGAARTIVVGNEAWPFPVPLIKDGNGWRFDTATGKEEVLARRIGRNELSVIAVCRAFVAAQRRYASVGHDGLPVRLDGGAIGGQLLTHLGLALGQRQGSDGQSLIMRAGEHDDRRVRRNGAHPMQRFQPACIGK